MDRGKSAGYSRFFPLICPSPPEFSRKFRCFCRLRRPISGQTLPRGDPNGPKTSRPAHLRGPPPGPGGSSVPGLQQRQHQKIPSAQRRNGCPRSRQLRRREHAVIPQKRVGATLAVAPEIPILQGRFKNRPPTPKRRTNSRFPRHCEEGAARRTPGWPLLPFGQFTFWQSRGISGMFHCRRDCHGPAGLAMTCLF